MTLLALGADLWGVEYSRDVRPILARRCYACHGPEASEGGLQLHTAGGARAELDSGSRAIVPGDVESSALLERIASDDPDVRMPPEGDPLTPAQIAILRDWIRDGGTFREHWAFRRWTRPQIPTIKDQEWVANPIDAFVMARLESDGLPVAGPAAPADWVRRLYFDVTGLPPAPEDVADYVASPSPAARDRIIRDLLESPRYGEHWGRHWLDVVRFAETNSFERDGPKPHAWRFRDYVIDALNADRPYDQFVREQLAGDELEPVTKDGIIATGFYRLGLWDDEPSDPEQLKYDVLDDIVRTTAQGFLGLTMDCARCHDHKIDPLTQQDYYRLVAFFHNLSPMQTQGGNIEREVFASDEERAEFARRHEAWESEVERLQALVASSEDAFAAAVPPESDLLPGYDLERIGYRWYSAAVSQVDEIAALPSGEAGRLPRRLLSLGVRRHDQDFAIIFDAQLRVPQGGEYTFVLDGDDGVRLTVDGQMIAVRDGLHQLGSPQTGTCTLPAGRVPLRLEYFQRGEQFGLELSWSGPGFSVRRLTAKNHAPVTEIASRFMLRHGNKVFVPAVMQMYRDHIARLEQLRSSEPQPPRALCVTENGLEPPVTRVLQRGNPHAPGEEVVPGFPGILGHADAKLPSVKPGWTTLHRRRALAEWIASADNPLTARVIANRVWQYHFGRGLVRSSNNFGLGGDPPTHPELLDWLAAELVDSGWSLKHLHRLILNSSTYGLSTDASPVALARDPTNDRLSHFDMRRLSAEELRDALLAVNGRLNTRMHGPGFFSEIPAEVLAGQSKPGDGWGKSDERERSRRSVYIHVKRSLLTPLLESFDMAETDNSCPVRFVTTQPAQALGLLNSGYLQKQAAAFARRLAQERPGDVPAQLQRGIELALARTASADEVAVGLQFVRELRESHGVTPQAALQQWCLLLYNLNEFVYVN